MNKTFTLIPALLLMTGCETVSWLQPLYAPEDIVIEDAIIGTWRADDGDRILIASTEERYDFIFEDKKGTQTRYSAYLIRIDGELYADLTEDVPGIPSHLLIRIEREDRRMAWYTLRDEWLRDGVKDGLLNATRIAEGRKDTRWVVNIPPAEAQRILRSYRYEAWEEAVRLERVQ